MDVTARPHMVSQLWESPTSGESLPLAGGVWAYAFPQLISPPSYAVFGRGVGV